MHQRYANAFFQLLHTADIARGDDLGLRLCDVAQFAVFELTGNLWLQQVIGPC